MSHVAAATLADQLAGYEDDPIGFAHDVLNIELDVWQCRVLEAIREHQRIAVRSSTGQGKDFTFAIAVYWFLASYYKAYCPCTANTKDQLALILWKQFADLHFGSNGLDQVFEWNATTVKHRVHGAEWLAFATTSAKKVSRGERHAEGSQGHHADNMLIGIDEASGVEEEFWGAYEFTLSKPNNKIVAIGNPNRLSGSFYQIWHKPIVAGFWQRFTIAGRPSKKPPSHGDNFFVSGRGNSSGNHDYLIAKYGNQHPWVQSKVDGVHPTSASQMACYAFDQVMAARVKGRIVPGDNEDVQIGIDLALRRDRIVYMIRRGRRFRFIVERKQSMHHIVDTALQIAESEPDPTAEQYDHQPLIVTDDGGLADAAAWIRKKGHRRVVGVHFGAAARNPKLYLNLATEMWIGDLGTYFLCRSCGKAYESHYDDAPADPTVVRCDLYDPNCEIPGDESGEEADELLSQLIVREWQATGKKDQMQIESKADMYERTGMHSPDHADGFCLSVVVPKVARLI